MRNKFTVIIIGLAILSSGILFVIRSNHHSPMHQKSKLVTTLPPTLAPKIDINYGLPTRLEITKVKVDAHVIYVGLKKDGTMNAPSNVIDTGWYKYGALPGNSGTAVIDGHLDGLRGEAGVFSELGKLVPGDLIKVTENNGLVVSFVVRETKKYPQTEQPAEVFNSTSGSHLNLITCTGSWNSKEHRFLERLVVFADKATI